MGGEAHHIHTQRLDIQVQKAGSLDSIGVHYDRLVAEHCLLSDQARYLGDRLDSADLVVRQHHADHDGPVPDGADHLVGIDEPVLVDRQIGHLEPELLQLVAGVQHGVVLDRGGDDVISKVT